MFGYKVVEFTVLSLVSSFRISDMSLLPLLSLIGESTVKNRQTHQNCETASAATTAGTTTQGIFSHTKSSVRECLCIYGSH